LIADQINQLDRFQGHWVVAGLPRWKKKIVPDFLGAASSISFVRKISAGKLKSSNADNLLIWSSEASSEIERLCNASDLKLWRMEDGFIRSVGLGALEHTRPLSLVIDGAGIYYDATRPSDLEILLEHKTFDAGVLERATKVRQQLIDLKLTKYNVGASKRISFPQDKTIILIPGQVETDASIRKGSPELKTNRGLLKKVRSENPEAFIIYKSHPDVVSGARKGELEDSDSSLYDLLVRDISIAELFENVDEVHTLSSLSGFEALIRGIKVVCYGIPFYAGWGLTTDWLSCARRTRKLSLDELVAGVLIEYPVYVDPATGGVCDIETVMKLLVQARQQRTDPSLLISFYRSLIARKN